MVRFKEVFLLIFPVVKLYIIKVHSGKIDIFPPVKMMCVKGRYRGVNMARGGFKKRSKQSRRRKVKPVKVRKFSARKHDNERAAGFSRGDSKKKDEVFSFLNVNGESDVKEIISAVGETRGQRKEIESLLANLYHSRFLLKSGKKSFRLNPKNFLEGTLSVHARGFAFATPVKKGKGTPVEKDLFIPARDLGTGLHGDRVLLQITGSRRGRFEARVVQVLERGTKSIVGIYKEEQNRGLVMPEDERYPLITVADGGGAEVGEAVLVEVEDFSRVEEPQSRQERTMARGKIIEVLGDPDSSLVQMQMVIRKFGLPHIFSTQSKSEAAGFTDKVELLPGRVDLRDVFHVTIDGETARDFDDAVSVMKTEKGFRLYVSIADVSHYVKPGTSLDEDAWVRGTSVYFPTGVLPMLPERLSNNLCSLNPDVDRYAFTAILDFDKSGKRLNTGFAQSVIRSKQRLTYTLVRQILVDKDAEVREMNSTLLTPLKWMAELGVQLEKRRMARGSMGFEIPETFIEIGPGDTINGISKRQRNLAHKIIEEFMLAANEAVAETFAMRKFAALYRIHQSPDTMKVSEFAEFMQSLGYELPRENYSSKWFNHLLEQTKETPREFLVSNLILRVMQQARYSPENIGHFGLAAPFYTHFTSPIRRYPDLMVHRALKQLLWPDGEKNATVAILEEAGEFLSTRERVAVDAEREMIDRLTVRYMEDKVGEEFAGIISGITSFGLFIQLTETMISGAVAITDLPGANYEFHEKRHALVNSWTNETFQVGDLVRVCLSSVDKRRQRINFVLAEDGMEGGSG